MTQPADFVDPFFGEVPPEEETGPPPRILTPPEERGPIEPVEIEQRRVCHFKKKPADPETGKKRNGCARCGKPKNHLDHLGAPGSFNAFGSGANQHVYQGLKKRWQEAITPKLEKAGLPRPLGKVLVEARVCFGDRTERDQGNFRVVIEKAMGDALVEGGWLEKDTWDHYEFGGLQLVYEQRENWTQFILFASWPDAGDEEPQAQLPV